MIRNAYFWLVEHLGFPEPLTNFFRKGYDKHPVFWWFIFIVMALLWIAWGVFSGWFIFHIAVER
jgi:hypothetical protein